MDGGESKSGFDRSSDRFGDAPPAAPIPHPDAATRGDLPFAPVEDAPATSAGPPPEGPYGPSAGYGYAQSYGQGYGGYGTGYGAPPGYGYPGYAYGYQPQQDKGATTALILGIVSIACCGLLGIWALIEGRKSRQRIRESNGYLTGDGMALAGMILGGIAIGIMVVSIIFQIVILSSSPKYGY